MMIESINKEINTLTIKTVEQVAPLILSDGVERYTLYVSPSDCERANKDTLFATKLLVNHKKSLEDGLKKVIGTNFVQEDFTSVVSGSNWKLLDIYDVDTDETYRLTVFLKIISELKLIWDLQQNFCSLTKQCAICH